MFLALWTDSLKLLKLRSGTLVREVCGSEAFRKARIRTTLEPKWHSCGWLCLALAGCGWLWLAVAGCGWLGLAVAGCGWLWLAVSGCGSLAVAGCGWLWLA